MRRHLLALAGLALALISAAPVLAQGIVNPPASGGAGCTTTCTYTGLQTIAPASTSVEGLNFNMPNTSTQNFTTLKINGSTKAFINYQGGYAGNGSITAGIGSTIGWYSIAGDISRAQFYSSNSSCGEITLSNDTNQTTSTKFSAVSANGPFRIGTCNSGTPTARSIDGEGSISGTSSNVGGADLTVSSGQGTGTGALSKLNLRSPVAVAGGTGAQTLTTGLAIIGGTARLTVYTVATLPACATVGAGAMAFVSDATTPTYNATLTGGGAVGVPVTCDGTNWKS